MADTLGLVMTGGGARGAYQAGVLQRIGEIPRVQKQGNPFAIIGGSSAGAINATAMAAGSDNLPVATKLTSTAWANLVPGDVFRCDLVSQAANSLTWIRDLSFGGALGGGNAHSLLDAVPLRNFLHRHLRCERIQGNIKKGHVYALAISATNYTSGRAYLFIQGRKGHPTWKRSRLITVPTTITVEHICASSAIPLVFQPVRLKLGKGAAYFGDGCIRLQQPLSPVIRLGATKIVAIGVRAEALEHQKETSADMREPALSQVMGVLFDAMFLDHLATDMEHLVHLNQLIEHAPPELDGREDHEQLRPLESLLITPSVDLSEVAWQHEDDMPYLIRYFLYGLGRGAASCSELLSYLLFASPYTRELIDIGYNDANDRIDEIEDFLFAGD